MTVKTSKWSKIFAALLSVCMLFSFTGCNKNEGSGSEISSDTSDENSQPENLHKIGYIFSDDADREFSFSWLMNEQRIKVSNRCGIETCYIDKVDITDFENAVKKLQAEGCTDIVAAGSNFANIAKTVSSRYMNLNFIAYGATSASPNTAAYTENIYQGAYVAGMVAAYNSHTRNIGIVVGSDLLQQRAVINAAALGAQLAFKTASIHVATAQLDNEIDEAVNSLLNKNCDVIICYTSSPRAEDYCQQRGVKFIGNSDFSGREEKYSKMLMYYYCKRDSYFLSQFKQMQLDEWSAAAKTGTMGNGAVVVSKALDACEDSAYERTKEESQNLINTLLPYVSSEAAYIFSGEHGELIDRNDIVKVMKNAVMTYSEIYSMDWYVKGVASAENFHKIRTEFPENSFEVKY